MAVAGERGGCTPHHLKYENRSASLIVDTNTNTGGVWSAAVTMPNVPVGTRWAYCHVRIIKGSSYPIICFEAATGYTLDDITSGGQFRKYVRVDSEVFSGSPTYGQSDNVWIPLDAALQFKWCTTVTSTDVEVSAPTDYMM